MNELLSGLLEPGQLEQRYEYYFPEQSGRQFTVMVMEPESPTGTDEEHRLLLAMRCKRFIDFALEGENGIEIFHDNSQRIVLLCREGGKDLSGLCEQIAQSIRDKLNCGLAIGVGSTYVGHERIKQTYKESLEALRYGKLKGSGIVFFNDDIRFEDQSLDIRMSGIEEAVFFIKTGIADKAIQAIDKLFLELSAAKGISVERARLVAVQFISALLNALDEMGIGSENNQRPFGILPYKRIFELDGLQAMKSSVIEIAEDAIARINNARSRRTNRIMEEVKALIHEEINQPELSLASVSRRFHMNPSYFSRVFKQDAGVSFSDYLFKIRMEKAMKLLNETDSKAYQIAEQIGIKDPFYFSHCFKKFTGMSIQEYKKSMS
ncbi:helix-turn-helix domain-containing protein [Cohnella suwonensis]|uniref:Helix-turn-helix domain-containing protein n=1 Tax=Cohnella suwonensis TaxID=696072 RepID=A0ABW0LWW3_9BACL